MKYRSRLEIIPIILECCQKGETQTKVMYHAYLSFSQTKSYIAMLVANGLLSFDSERRRYHTTNKGVTYLAHARELNGLSDTKI